MGDAMRAAGAPGETEAERAAWLADKIAALGDYAKEAAAMLRRWPDGDECEELNWIVNGFLEWHEGNHCPKDLIERARAAVPPDYMKEPK
jgi:hypothetical protein